MAEYGNPSFISIHVIHEYGKLVIDEYAVNKIMTYFQ
jgi:adapter protein MecA 1/2